MYTLLIFSTTMLLKITKYITILLLNYYITNMDIAYFKIDFFSQNPMTALTFSLNSSFLCAFCMAVT